MQQLTYVLDEHLSPEEMGAKVAALPAFQEAACRLQIVFSPSCDRAYLHTHLKRAQRMLPDTTIVGMTTMGRTKSDMSIQEHTVCTFLLFDNAEAHVSVYDCRELSTSEAGQRLCEEIDNLANPKAVFVASSYVRLALAPFIDEISLGHPSIPLFGAQAGTQFIDNDQSLVFAGDKIYDCGIVAVTFCGEDLHIKPVNNLGWRAIGNDHIISSCNNSGMVLTIDNEPAISIYRRYLNIMPDDAFFNNVCSFPLVMRSGKQLVARTPIGFGIEGGLQFPASVERGSHVRFSYAHPTHLMRETRYSANEMCEFEPEGLLLFACISRRIFLGSKRAEEEVRYYRRACPNMAWAYGFGEILKTEDGGGHLNSTIIALGMREGNPSGNHPEPLKEPQFHLQHEYVPLSERLATLLETTTSELNETISELETVAKRDQLTGAFNRRRMDEVIHYELSKRRKEDYLVLLMYDIDYFKQINDTYGHDVGDVVLKDLTRCVQMCIRSGDTLGRWGGEEFLCLLTSVSLEQACMVAERIRARVEHTEFLRVGKITISIGLTSARSNDTPESFFQRVDKALYDAKHAGRNCVRVR